MSDAKQLDSFKSQFRLRCFALSLSILNLWDVIPTNVPNRIILDQLIRSGTSIGANVTEGGSSISKKEFIRFFQIALKSSSESIYWLLLLKERNPRVTLLPDIIEETSQIKKLLTTIITNSKKDLNS